MRVLKHRIFISLIILVSFLVGSMALANPTHVVGELCYVQPHSGTYVTQEDITNNLYVGLSFNYQVYYNPDLNAGVDIHPSVVYNPVEGPSIGLGISATFLFFGGGHNFTFSQGATFPQNFLNTCNLYIRVNLNESNFQ